MRGTVVDRLRPSRDGMIFRASQGQALFVSWIPVATIVILACVAALSLFSFECWILDTPGQVAAFATHSTGMTTP